MADFPDPKVISARLEFQIHGMHWTNTIQRYYVGSTYVYALQKHDENPDDPDTHVDVNYIHRLLIDDSTSPATATYQDSMRMNNVGHTQTLSWYQHNGHDYFWVGTNFNTNVPDEEKHEDWADQLGRVEYVAGKTINYTDVSRLITLARASQDGSSFGHLYRADSALSSDNGHMLVWAENNYKMYPSETRTIRYTIYDFNAINVALDAAEIAGRKTIACDDAEVRAAVVYHEYSETKDFFLPHGSCQGVELTNADSIYVCGGGSADFPEFGRMSHTGGSQTSVEAQNPEFKDHKSETEGIQIKDNRVYFGITDSDNPIDERFHIWSFPSSDF
ncbi:hypothetical protein EQG49_00125 [Periweissella cryptocerci]|uniref:Uncharacterized protein n=1 Tax=Periweissella cryptocerci TaxID=2506420 RepID=A0A4P6YQS4_9LACO|nr:helveticin J family class III bacteriocin [Periweissella cryptocerci]QBO34960.1 hypothetical protein EQG49_00125 [Periweissella cryptocerci]